jgi:hypothetical protein
MGSPDRPFRRILRGHVWLIYVVVGFALLIAGGLYVRRRLAGALEQVGVSRRWVRVVRWALPWLLYAYPVLVMGAIFLARAIGAETIPRFDGVAAAVLLGVPFVLAALIVVQALPWLLAIDVAHLVVRRRRGAPAAARLRAIAVLVVVAAFAIYTPVRILIERGDVRFRTHAVGAGTGAPLRIAFVADVQQDAFTDGDDARALYRRVDAARPDLVLSGGDWINTGPDHIAAAAEAAGTLRARLGVFSVRGDHEHFAYVDRDRSVGEVARALAAHGIAMLADEVRWFEHGDKRIGVVFLNYTYIHRADPAAVARLLDEVAAADYSILVTHQFDDGLAARVEGKVDLVLAGHTHGGQINPVVGVVHVELARLESRYIDGRYRLGARTTVIVTAGVGTSIAPIRYAAPGSVELIELRP